MTEIKTRKIVVLATDGVEQVEFTEPVKALKQAGAQPIAIAPHRPEQCWRQMGGSDSGARLQAADLPEAT